MRRPAQIEGRMACGWHNSSFETVIEAARRMIPSLPVESLPNPLKDEAFVYFLRLRSGKIYVGCTIDLEQRLEDHSQGVACYTTKIDPPVELLRLELCPHFPSARRREAQLKKWSGQKKEALARGNLVLLKKLARSHD